MSGYRPGHVIRKRYRLLSELGSGGMGHIWLAEDKVLGRNVALKELVLVADGERLTVRRQRALREARAAASVEHGAIVQIFDVFLEKGNPWIVMEHIRGRSLQRLIDEGAFTETGPGERRLASISGRVLDALRAAHRADVLHRDVKPANILIGDDGDARLLDFGIAQISGQSRLTSTSVLTGTLEFMAPERLEGAEPGPAADLWSLGVTLFCALEGRSPFRRDGAPATMRAILDQHPPRPARGGPLPDAVMRLLHKDPARRMAAGELASVLAEVATGRPRPPARPAAVRPEPPRTTETRTSAPPAAGTGGTTAADPAYPPDPETMDATALARDLSSLDPDHAARVLLSLPAPAAARILSTGPPRSAAPLLAAMVAAPRQAVAALRAVGAARAGRIFDYLPTGDSVVLLEAMPPDEALRIVTHADARTAADLIDAVAPAPAAGRLIEAMSLRRACSVLGHVPPATVAMLLSDSRDGRAARLVNGLPPPARTQVERLLREQGRPHRT